MLIAHAQRFEKGRDGANFGFPGREPAASIEAPKRQAIDIAQRDEQEADNPT
jgi:hypothetical protein